LEYAQNADIRLLMFDGAASEIHTDTLNIKQNQILNHQETILAINKADTGVNTSVFAEILPQAIEISAKNEQGLEALLTQIAEILKNQFNVSRETVHLTRNRHRENIASMHQNILNAFEITEPELLAQELRFALYSIGRITGKIDVEDLLDVIFKDFCIGK
jgi:tRNA modification GTPase